MDGTSIMQGVAVVFAAQAFGISLSLMDYVVVVGTATLASIGTAGVPSVGLVTLTMVFNSVGLPVEAIGLIMGIDRTLTWQEPQSISPAMRSAQRWLRIRIRRSTNPYSIRTTDFLYAKSLCILFTGLQRDFAICAHSGNLMIQAVAIIVS